ncbi:S26 family signal peptidase [Bacillus niameyensis]|uniref:S26 family signal peptidase n=1 Tax=Bacillus niameyensis TaxID=1522308 RepID=UPI000784751C|nr:S26 family signal peptidase [Bacillus niameyensis]
MRIVFFIILSGFIFVGCSTKDPLTDEYSIQNPTNCVDSLEENMIEVRVYADSFQRDGNFPNFVVVDTSFYINNEIQRGDIVYFEDKQGLSIARVLALPKEELEIKKGQVYINNRKLNTFYGHEYRWAGGITSEKIDTFTMDNILIDNDSYFLAGDNWWRSPTFEPIQKKIIEGKVIGILCK